MGGELCAMAEVGNAPALNPNRAASATILIQVFITHLLGKYTVTTSHIPWPVQITYQLISTRDSYEISGLEFRLEDVASMTRRTSQ